MFKKNNKAVRICDVCGEPYYGEEYAPYGECICNQCLKSEDLPLITTDDPDFKIPSSVSEEFDNGKDEEDAD